MRVVLLFVVFAALLAAVSASTNFEPNQLSTVTISRYRDGVRSLRSTEDVQNDKDDGATPSDEEERGLLRWIEMKRFISKGTHPSEVFKIFGKTDADKYYKLWHKAQAAKDAAQMKELAKEAAREAAQTAKNAAQLKELAKKVGKEAARQKKTT